MLCFFCCWDCVGQRLFALFGGLGGVWELTGLWGGGFLQGGGLRLPGAGDIVTLNSMMLIHFSY